MEYQTLALAAIFSDHMVLQRYKPIRIWGYCPADDKITVIREEARQSDEVGLGENCVNHRTMYCECFGRSVV